MQAISVGSTVTTLIVAGNVPFIHIYNNSDSTIFLSYDGVDATVAAGIPLPSGGVYQLNNDGTKQIFTRGVTAISVAGGKEVRVQGA